MNDRQANSRARSWGGLLALISTIHSSNTYTNETWSEVSGIDLEEVNKMEREFLKGIEFRLCVHESDYQDWLLLLKGLVMTKERDSQRMWRSRSQRSSRHGSSRTVNTPRIRPSYHRARSTSPTESCVSFPFMFTAPPTFNNRSIVFISVFATKCALPTSIRV
jgi:hypothetical protein